MSQPTDTPRKKARLNREQQKASRVQDLLEAARILFREQGYEAVSIEQVAEYAGCSRTPVYTIFGDRHNLVFELWRSTTADLEQTLFRHFVPGSSLRTNLAELAGLLAESLGSETPPGDSERLFFVVQTIAQSRPEIAEKVSDLALKVIRDVAQFIRQCSLANGEHLRSDSETVASHLIAYINGLATVQFQTRSRNVRAKDLISTFNSIVFADA